MSAHILYTLRTAGCTVLIQYSLQWQSPDSVLETGAVALFGNSIGGHVAVEAKQDKTLDTQHACVHPEKQLWSTAVKV